mmetsp:Transcript_31946/g.69762  ORF Transcript_31946/g.69762 Transcript_31946/m.69762 type:complete len:258 (-) Transcript_31946:20-793(-)
MGKIEFAATRRALGGGDRPLFSTVALADREDDEHESVVSQLSHSCLKVGLVSTMPRVDLSGNGKDRITHCAVLVHDIRHSAPDQLRGFLGTVDAVGHFLNPWGHGRTQCQSWLTHFAVLLKFENDERLWIFERDTGGVDLYPLDQGRTRDFRWKWRQWIRYDDSRPVARACNLAFCGNDFHDERSYGRTAQRQDVWNRYHEQRSIEYNLLTKNCQHFAYDFYKWTIEHVWIRWMNFPDFGKMIQGEFVNESELTSFE